MDQPLSSRQIKNELPGVPIHIYADLNRFTTLEQVLGSRGAAVLLYPGESDTNGHWVTLFKNKNDKGKPIIEFFDPYGTSIDQEFQYTPIKHPHYLARLMVNSPYDIEYNEYRMQKMEPNISTCGKHVINRLKNRHLTLKQYAHMFKGEPGGVTADQIVQEVYRDGYFNKAADFL